MRPLRLGLLGTGIAARQLYWPQLKDMKKKVQLVACANRTRSKAEAFARETGIPTVVADAKALFALPQVEAVLISLPIADQPRYVLQALKAGKHVLSEKPMAPTLASGRALVKAAKPYTRKGLVWLVAENYFFMQHTHQAEAWLAQGKLGDVRLVEVRQSGRTDAKVPYFHTAWRRDKSFEGGFVVDAGVHLAHIVRRWFGLPKEVRSLTAQFNPDLPPMDTAAAALRFNSGALGLWLSSFSAPAGGPMIALRGSRADLEIHRAHTVLRPHFKGKELAWHSSRDSYGLQFERFAEAVLQGKPLGFTPEEALADLAFMLGVVQGRPLKP